MALIPDLVYPKFFSETIQKRNRTPDPTFQSSWAANAYGPPIHTKTKNARAVKEESDTTKTKTGPVTPADSADLSNPETAASLLTTGFSYDYKNNLATYYFTKEQQ